MRNTFVNTLFDLVKNDNDTFLITGDLGFGVLDKFKEEYPNKYLNAGISEQNMSSIAAGMALEGKKIFTYSIANFPTLRCLEQIRNDITYHDADVKIVSIGAGMAYGGAGMSHHATEDISIIRALPNITVFSPSDPIETKLITKEAYKIKGPCYLRLGKGGEENIHSDEKDVNIYKANLIIGGNEVCIFSTGSITSEAVEAANQLNKIGISTAVYTFPIIKPIDFETIIECSKKYDYIITVEEHTIMGGFGSAVAEVMAETKLCNSVLKRLGLPDVYASVVGSQKYLRDVYGISCNKIVEAIKKMIKR